MYALLVGGRSARRPGKFIVAVLKASMLDCQGGRSAKVGVVVFKASMFNCQEGIDLPVHLPSLV